MSSILWTLTSATPGLLWRGQCVGSVPLQSQLHHELTALLRGVPHLLPLHHWLDKILKLELGIEAEAAGHLAQVLLPRGLLVKVAGVDPLASSTMLPLSHKCATVILFWVREKDHMQMHIASHHNLLLQLIH